MKPTVLIAGGGIGGLATAAAFAQRGWNVTVFERQPELRTVGSGIYIWDNGLRVLEALGIEKEATRLAFYGAAFEHRDQDNRVIDTMWLSKGSRLVTVMRMQLLQALEAACVAAGVAIRTNRVVAGASPRGELIFADGERLEADLVVGVDGVWSKVREGLGIPCAHQLTREGCLRTIVPREASDFGPNDTSRYIENWRGSRRFLITPISDTSIYLALTCMNDDEARALPIDKAMWATDFPAWRHLIDRIGQEATWGCYSIVECPTWSVGRSAILGDAAHAQPPNLGQGGGMAIQNGLALAAFMEHVRDRRDVPSALEAWEREVRPLTDHCQRWSRLYGEIAYLPDNVRSKLLKAAAEDPWASEQFMRAANSLPIAHR